MLDVFDERSFLLPGENGRLDKLLTLLLKVPHQNAFRTGCPDASVVVNDVVDVLGVAYVDLVRFSHEGIVPNLHEGVVPDAEEQVVVQLEVDGVEFVAMQGLHLDLNGHLNSVIAAD
jgi:hypothetical protein